MPARRDFAQLAVEFVEKVPQRRLARDAEKTTAENVLQTTIV
jgi:hypothetical protein